MRFGSLFLLFALLSVPLAVEAGGTEHIASKLDSLAAISYDVTYSVTLPQAQDDVVYSISFTVPDTASWLITWSVKTPQGDSVQGWSARTPQGIYDFSHNRLREHHPGWDNTPEPKVMFSQFLPRNIASQLREMTQDSAFTVSTSGQTIECTRSRNGITDAELSWSFSPSGLPLLFTADYNPGAISSQQVHASFSPSRLPLHPVSEQWLAETYPDAFLHCRESNFAVENLRGKPFPSFSLPMAMTEGRLHFTPSDNPFSTPFALVIADPAIALTPMLIHEVRRAIDSLPRDAEVIWAFTGNHPYDPDRLLGSLRPGETAVCSASSLAAKCGAASLPVIVCCNSGATVENVLIGLNKSTCSDVINALARAK